MLGYCGINCLECKAYKGTVNGDEDLLKQVATQFWNGVYSPRDWVCLGCGPHNQHFHAKFCSTCNIRLCATEREVQNCAACPEFERCSKLQEFIKSESPEIVRTMQWLRESYLATRGQAV